MLIELMSTYSMFKPADITTLETFSVSIYFGTHSTQQTALRISTVANILRRK